MKLGVIGLGYVGLPLAVKLAVHYEVIGFDVNTFRVSELRNNFDANDDIETDELKNSQQSMLYLTNAKSDLKNCNMFIITVPTPVDENFVPDLRYVKQATETVGHFLKKDDIVVYESTVYPGTTQEVCIPILEKISNLISEVDFFVGYSPERINPGDKINTIETVKKIVSAQSDIPLQKIKNVYEKVVKAGTYSATSIKVAEMAKVVENAQRDVNIAFMNEISTLCHTLDIKTHDVLDAAKSKWNFLDFHPGLVGGHCIGVDPYYLIYKAQMHSKEMSLLKQARIVNEQMVNFVLEKIKQFTIKNVGNYTSKTCGVFGLTFKANVPDFRNSKNLEIAEQIVQKINFKQVMLFDPYAEQSTINSETIVNSKPDNQDFDVYVILTPHNLFSTESIYKKMFATKKAVVIDVTGKVVKNSEFSIL